MREICLDTETTGLKPEEGHRIIEIGAVELIDKVPTGKEYHVYINPEREVPQEAVNIHGITNEFLADKPLFADIAEDFLAFIGDAMLVIHNAEFDRRFINAEFERLGIPPIERSRCVDTLPMARARFPGAPASLDALCKRFGIDNSHRDLHGALLDAQLLAQVYLELTGGRQRALGLESDALASAAGNATSAAAADSGVPRHPPRPAPLPSRLSTDAVEQHARFIETLGEEALWRRFSRT